MPQLTPHFHSSEFDCRDGTPVPPRALRRYRHLCLALLEPMRREWGRCVIVSGFRTATHNSEVGGAPRSFHMLIPGRPGVAADVTFERGTPTDWAAMANRLGAGGLGVYESTVHVDTRRATARW